MDKNIIGEKIAFIIHKIVFGVIYYGGFTFFNKLQNSALKLKNGAFNFLGYFIPILLLIWFFDINRKKNTWKPLGKYSETVETIIILLTILVLHITIK
jgi:hypothetical protein